MPSTGRPAGFEAIQDPHGLAALRALFQHVTQGGDERVDAAAQILQVDEQHVEAVHHRGGRTTHLPVETEDRNAERGIVEVGRLDHVVLLVATQAVLRPERRGQLHVAQRGQRIERMCEIRSDRRRMRQQRDPLAGQRLAQRRLRQQTIDSVLHAQTSRMKPAG